MPCSFLLVDFFPVCVCVFCVPSKTSHNFHNCLKSKHANVTYLFKCFYSVPFNYRKYTRKIVLSWFAVHSILHTPPKNAISKCCPINYNIPIAHFAISFFPYSIFSVCLHVSLSLSLFSRAVTIFVSMENLLTIIPFK